MIYRNLAAYLIIDLIEIEFYIYLQIKGLIKMNNLNQTRKFYEPKRDLAIVFLAALLLRVIYLILMSNQYTSLVILNLLEDSKTYIDIARYFLGVNAAGADDLLLAGPGYGILLAASFKLFGFGCYPILIMQIIISSLSCVLIYKISFLLLNNRKISLIAGVLAAISLTSISLSNAVLSDSIFFFLLTLAIYNYLIGFNHNLWKPFVICGLLLGLATLVRSVGLFFPAVLIIMALILPLRTDSFQRKSLFIKAIVSGLIIIIVALPWAIKNKVEHDIFTVSETGTLAARNYLASRIIYEEEKSGTLLEIRNWMASTKIINGRPETAAERHAHAVTVIKTVFSKYPGPFIRVFLTDIWENITTLDTIHALQLPGLRNLFEIYTNKISTKGRSSLIFFLSIIGFVLMFWERRSREALALALIYLYFAFLSGFTYWQGSRIFYPGQLAWIIFVAVVLYQIAIAIGKLRRYLSGQRAAD